MVFKVVWCLIVAKMKTKIFLASMKSLREEPSSETHSGDFDPEKNAFRKPPVIL
jgi:hypothetical protein